MSKIITKPQCKEYSEAWDRIFKDKSSSFKQTWIKFIQPYEREIVNLWRQDQEAKLTVKGNDAKII